MTKCLRDNTVGSLSETYEVAIDNESAYILGLWCADGYYWSSSIGITNVNERLVRRFEKFLVKLFPKERIHLRTYLPMGSIGVNKETSTYEMRLAKQKAYQLYVNSRPLLRAFKSARIAVHNLPKHLIPAYFAGRFDGDGSVDKNG